MLVKTRIFQFCNGEYGNLSELAEAMGISVSQIYRVRGGKRQINQKFIVGAIKAFPNHKLDDLFYLVSESPTVTRDEPVGTVEGTPPAPEGSPQLQKSMTSTSTAELVPP